MLTPGIEVHCGSAGGSYGTVIGTAVGGFIGFASSLGTTWYSNRLNRKADERQRRDERIRELYETVGQFEEKFGADVRAFGERIPITLMAPTDFETLYGDRALGRKMKLLLGPEFPEARNALKKADNIYEGYKLAVGSRWNKPMFKEHMNPIYDLANMYTQALQDVMRELFEEVHGKGTSFRPRN